MLRANVAPHMDMFIQKNTIQTRINDLWRELNSTIILLQTKYVPSKLTSKRLTHTWFTKARKSKVTKKKKLYIKAKRTNLRSDWNNFREAAAVARKTCKQVYNNFVSKTLSASSSENPRRFFSYVKTKRCENIGIAPLRENGTIVISNIEKARVLNNQFWSVFTKEDFRIPKLTSPLSLEIPKINIDIEGVRRLMKHLDPFKAIGPDKVQSQFLKLMGEELSAGMTLIFRASFHQAKIPNAWWDALVSLLYKSGKTGRSIPENYRPISLTSASCKMLEHIIHSNVIEHLDHNNIITSAQHGFRSKRSCETQLMKSVHDLVKSLNDGEQIDSILLDFLKTFG